MKAQNKPTYCYCQKCGKPVTWFNFQNIWEGGKIVARKHTDCNAPEILGYKTQEDIDYEWSMFRDR